MKYLALVEMLLKIVISSLVITWHIGGYYIVVQTAMFFRTERDFMIAGKDLLREEEYSDFSQSFPGVVSETLQLCTVLP